MRSLQKEIGSIEIVSVEVVSRVSPFRIPFREQQCHRVRTVVCVDQKEGGG